ncbi:hypothetical protein LTR28_003316, partial [Elasticomyces elasticus]
GAYRGKASFDTFTHRRSVTSTPGWIEGLLSVRYPPYAGKLEKFRKQTDLKPNFDRDGRVKIAWTWLALGLGSNSGVGALGRWVALMALALGLRQWTTR